jgi:hypothetical protein
MHILMKLAHAYVWADLSETLKDNASRAPASLVVQTKSSIL